MSKRPTIRVLIADDHRTFAEALRTAIDLQEGFKVTGIAMDGRGAVRMALEGQPHVVLLDVRMPGGMDGIEATREIKRLAPSARVVMLSAYHNETLVARAIEAGAIGYLSKALAVSQVADAIRAAFDGEPLLDPQEVDRLLSALRRRREAQEHARQRVDRLTPRETEILQRMADGLSQEEIALLLGISPHTLRTHVQNILTKLRVHSKLEALAEAVRYGKVTLGETV